MKQKKITRLVAALLAAAVVLQMGLGYQSRSNHVSAGVQVNTEDVTTTGSSQTTASDMMVSTITVDTTTDVVTTVTTETTTDAVTTVTTESATTTGDIAATTTAAPAATTADSNGDISMTMDDSFGYALLNGETMPLDFTGVDTIYIPIDVKERGYLTVMRQDESTDVMKVSVLDKDKKEKLLSPKKLEGQSQTGSVLLQEDSYFIKVAAPMDSSYEIALKMTTGLEMTSRKKTTLSLGKHEKESFYMEFTADKTGLLTLENKSSSKFSVKLCNADKSALSGTKTLEKYSKKNHKSKKNSVAYGVKKAEHYLICITAASSVKSVSLQYTIKSYSSLGGTSLTKSYYLKKKKTVSATLPAGKSEAYYSFKKSSRRRINLEIKTMRNQGKLVAKLYYKEVKGKNKGKILPVKVNKKQLGWTQKPEHCNTLKISAYWPNVTYYVKLYNEGTTSSGSYTIKIK